MIQRALTVSPGEVLAVAPHAVYVYYKVSETALADTVQRARRMQAELLADRPGVRGMLQRRPGSQHGLVTLMESYQSAGGDDLGPTFLAALAGASASLPRPRHTEVFEPA